jgi:hypothetical protein
MIISFISSCFLYASVSAAGIIPNTDLRLELRLATGSADTSGLSRIVTSTGIAPTYSVDSIYGIPNARFTGSGWLKVNTSWSSSIDNFTVSFWMKHSWSFMNWTVILTWATKQIRIEWAWPSLPSDYRDDTYSTSLAQTIFTSDDNGGTKLIINSAWKCSLRGWNGTALIQSTFLGSVRNAYGTWASLYKNDYRVFDVWTNMQEFFNCSQLLDKKWHNVVIMRNLNVLTFSIDGVEVAKFTTTPFSIGRNITLGLSETLPLTYSGKLSTAEVATVAKMKYFQWNMAGFRLYSRVLSDLELQSLGDEFRYAQSELVWAGNIQVSMDKYASPDIFVNFKNIPLALKKESVTYEYATDGKTFSPVTSITNISTGTGFLDYKVMVDLTGKPDGLTVLTFRVRATNQSFQTLGTVRFNKLDNIANIEIAMPSADISTSKTISAYATGAQLSMFVTTSTTCDASVTAFESYSDLTFTNKLDNGKRVCYKAIYLSTNKTIYKLSSVIQWIQSLDEKTVSANTRLFDTYLLWAKSNYPKISDTSTLVLDLLSVSATSSNGTINGVTMTDINGDGLVDFLYSRNDPIRRAIIVNNGNYTFKTAYKCAIDLPKDAFGNIIPWALSSYYGDCADTIR